MSSKQTVRVYNPAGGTGVMRAKKAAQYVSRGRARWRAPGLVEFIESDHRCASAIKTARKFTNGVGLATLEGLRHTPVVAPIRLLFGKKLATTPREDVIGVISVRSSLMSCDASGKMVEVA